MKKLLISLSLPATVFGGILCVTPGALEAQTGSIAGTIALEAPRPRRSVDRYRPGAAPVHEIQQVPAVAYLVGPIAGTASRSSSTEMVQQDTAFAPAAVFVSVGQQLAFPNRDPFFHNVFSYSSPARFDLGRYPRGESKSVRFDEVGIVDVFCEVHEFMRGAIIVTENAFHAIRAEDGTFRIDGVPAGEHTLAVWHPDHNAAEQTVTVTSGTTTAVEVRLRR